tara:strand:- start:463 stop:837 length:375 start_codon:yes stop_codon:yes gene_type:complete
MTNNIIRDPNNGYTHRTVEIKPNSRILFVSGQTATDENGNTPEGIEKQAEVVYEKIIKSLKNADMSIEDLVKTNVYLVNPEDIGAVYNASKKYNPQGKQAGTLVYVKGLARPEVLIEIEAVAAK